MAEARRLGSMIITAWELSKQLCRHNAKISNVVACGLINSVNIDLNGTTRILSSSACQELLHAYDVVIEHEMRDPKNQDYTTTKIVFNPIYTA